MEGLFSFSHKCSLQFFKIRCFRINPGELAVVSYLKFMGDRSKTIYVKKSFYSLCPSRNHVFSISNKKPKPNQQNQQNQQNQKPKMLGRALRHIPSLLPPSISPSPPPSLFFSTTPPTRRRTRQEFPSSFQFLEKGMSSVVGRVDKPMLGETIGEFFSEKADILGNKMALHVPYQGINWTWKELSLRVDCYALGLLHAGFRNGDRIGCWMPTCAEWLVLQLATAKIGVILVNLNTNYTAPELAAALTDVECSGIVLTKTFRNLDYQKILEEAVPDVKNARNGKIKDPKTSLRFVAIAGEETVSARYRPFKNIAIPFTNPLEREFLDEKIDEVKATDAVNIQFTSGTTGRPKGATLTHRNILNNGLYAGENMNVTENDVFCIPVPLFHCFGMVLGNLAALTHGSTIIYPGPIFDPVQVLDSAEKYQATVLHGVPTMFIRLLEHLNNENIREYNLNLRTGIMAGSVCPVEVLKKVKEELNMKEVTVCYGMTETSPISFQTPIGAPEEKQVTTVGTVCPWTQSKIVNEEGNIVPLGESGELIVKGYLVMKGYYNDPEKTNEIIDEKGWIKTGDLAKMDEEGYVQIVGRLKDMIIRGGENIYPSEIEDVLHAHPDIEDVSIVGIPCEEMGEAVCGWVKAREGSTITEEEIMDFCHGKLSKYKIPKHFVFEDEFPMTANGKHQKHVMTDKSVDILKLKGHL